MFESIWLWIAAAAMVVLTGAAWAVGTRRLTRRLAAIRDAAMESTSDGILIVDGKGRMVAFNRRFVGMWRLPDAVANFSK